MEPESAVDREGAEPPLLESRVACRGGGSEAEAKAGPTPAAAGIGPPC